MLTNVSSSAGASGPTNDSLESLGLSGTSLMQLWGLGIDSISELTQHTAESLRLKLKDSSDTTLSSRKRNEQTLNDVLAAIKRRHQSLREVEGVSAPRPEKKRNSSAEHHPAKLYDDVSEHEKLDLANEFASKPHKESLGVAYGSRLRRYSILGRDEQVDLFRQYKEGGSMTARDKLVTHNLRLVLQIARKHLWSQLEYDDLVQEGTIGLMTAIEKFDPSLGALSTYATWWIRQAISRFIQDYSSVIRVPVHLGELVYKVRRTMDDIALSKGRPPTLKELAETLAMDPKRVKQVLKVIRMKISSLNEPVAAGGSSRQEDGRVEHQDMLFDETSLRADHVLEARQELAAACERINQITEMVFDDWSIQDRNKDIFVRFYGLDGTLEQRTLDHTAEKYTVTRERVRQIIEQIWRKLQRAGCDSDHENLLEELQRIAALEKLANKSVSVK